MLSTQEILSALLAIARVLAKATLRSAVPLFVLLAPSLLKKCVHVYASRVLHKMAGQHSITSFFTVS